jgi:hypothetical protein
MMNLGVATRWLPALVILLALITTGSAVAQGFLTLTVSQVTGGAVLKNDSPYDVFISGYAINSPSGSLRPANGSWNSLADQTEIAWQEVLASSTAISEMRQFGSTRLIAGSGYNLGTPFRVGFGIPDLSFEFLQQGHVRPTQGPDVVYSTTLPTVSGTNPGVLGDFNSNLVVDAADYTAWRDNLGSNAILRNDPIGGTLGLAQYELWRDNFGNAMAGGAAASAGAMPAGVPEPTTLLLLLTVFGGLASTSSLVKLSWRRPRALALRGQVRRH